jgi:hypothetical protein
MLLKIAGSIALIGTALYLLNRLYCIVVRLKARNVGIFRDDRRENDER